MDGLKIPQRGEKFEFQQTLTTAVFGAIDGSITTFVVVAGTAGAMLDTSIVLIIGFANLLGDSISMAVGNYLSQKSSQEYAHTQRILEMAAIEVKPEEKKKQLKEIYKSKGLSDDKVDELVNVLISDKKIWLETIMSEALELAEPQIRPLKMALIMFFSFVLIGSVPLIVYILSYFVPYVAEHTLFLATFFTFITFFGIGATKSIATHKPWWHSGLETLLIGGAAAVVAYYIGAFIESIV